MSGLSYLSRKLSFVSFTCRSSSKPPLGKPNRKDHRKRNRPEDDELDPMDPSSYSDAPRGGWYMTSLFLLNYYPVDFHKLSWCLLLIILILALTTECMNNKLCAPVLMALHSCFCRVVGLKGVQPRAADTTAAVCSLFCKIYSVLSQSAVDITNIKNFVSCHEVVFSLCNSYGYVMGDSRLCGGHLATNNGISKQT